MKKIMLLFVVILLVGCIQTTSEINYNVDVNVKPFPISVGKETMFSFRLVDESNQLVDFEGEYDRVVKINGPNDFLEEYRDIENEPLKTNFPVKGSYNMHVEFLFEDKYVGNDLPFEVN